jgi:hypothetical protein
MSKDNIVFLGLNSYVREKLVENEARNWVLNGRNNKFYDYVIDRYNGSPTNATIINSFINLIYGQGLSYRGNTIETFLKFNSILSKKELRKIISDFELFGEASLQIIKTRDKKSIANIYHLPKEKVVPSIETLEGDIEYFWYCKNWKNTTKYPPERFPAFGTSSEEIEIYCISPYKAGKNYFSDPDYLAGMPYAEMEEEIANLYINSIKKGLSAGYVINIPNGTTLSPEEKDNLERQIKAKIVGSPNAMSFVLNFMAGDQAITVEAFPVNENIHKQWEYLTGEARQQLLTAHGVVSPMLFGVKDSTGLGNNADELDTAEAQLMKRVIAPKQAVILDAFDEILSFYDINLNLYFKPLTELPMVTDVAMSSHVCCSDEKKNLDTNVADELIGLGEDIGDEWVLVDSEIVTSETNFELAKVNTGTARPNDKSKLDGEKFKSRLRYGGELSSNSREFCRKMVSANKLYRIEDINAMSNKVVNEGWGAGGANTYDILLYKGGGACRHFWIRESYRLKADVNSPLAQEITPAQARKQGEILPKLESKVFQKPNDMPNNGFLNK